MGRTLKWATMVLAATAIGVQFAGPARTNPQADESLAIERTETIPPGVARTLDIACRDCHSNRTRWRWYSYVAPVSWWTIDHVKQGRADLNFSIWATYSERMRETRLHAMCAMSEKREMPLPAYAMVHSEARISDDQIRELCAWTKSRTSRP